jgi:hypothetical protein
MQAIKGSEWTWFIKAARKDGIAVALSRHPEHTRKKLREQLENCQDDWYESLLKIWSSYQNALEVVQHPYLLTLPTPTPVPLVIPVPIM